MMGIKERTFRPLPHLSLEEFVPQENFYRRLERTLELSFVRELVKERYATGGRPSIGPVVFFRLQLVMFFEGIRSERRLMEVVEECFDAGLVWGEELYFDATKVEANASSLDSMRSRSLMEHGLEEHLAGIFPEEVGIPPLERTR